jgi:hypothetical protein
VLTLLAHYLQTALLPIDSSAWYAKPLPTFADALAMVRRTLWAARLFPGSVEPYTTEKVPPELLEIWWDLLCCAA